MVMSDLLSVSRERHSGRHRFRLFRKLKQGSKGPPDAATDIARRNRAAPFAEWIKRPYRRGAAF